MGKTDGAAKVGEALEKLVGLFEGEAGVSLPEAVARTLIVGGAGTRPSDFWSLSNRLVMWLSGTEDARGFKQWKKAGRSVKKGTRAIWILAPLTRTRLVEDEKRPGGDKVPVSVLVGFKGVPVFRVEDTEGEPVPDREDHRPDALPPLFGVAGELGISVRYAPAPPAQRGRRYGSYHLSGDRIDLLTHDEGVFFHELAHAAHDRITPGGLTGGQDPRQEIVAETAAAALSLVYGLDGYVANSKTYIEGYARKSRDLLEKPAGDPGRTAAQAVVGVIAEVERVLAYILEPARRPSLEARRSTRTARQAPAA